MRGRLTRGFFLRPALIVAKDLLGKVLVRSRGGDIKAGKIVETEAYVGVRDRASHAYGGKVTPRNMSEYLHGGHVYIYLCYGMYWQLNVTVMEEGVPECVLIRALEPVAQSPAAGVAGNAVQRGKAAGPGRLCRWLRLGRSFDREDLVESKRLWIEDWGERIRGSRIIAARRIGIDYAGAWADKPFRFLVAGSPFVSRPPGISRRPGL
jgi:DNA-3-methyladenine glycosylase